MKPQMTGTIYALTTPQGAPFYVGATVQRPRARVRQHLRDALSGRKGSAVHELLSLTKRTGFWILETSVPLDRLGLRERRHKLRLQAAGFDLLNYHHGANGCTTQSEAARKRIRAFALKRPRDGRGRFVPAIAGGAPTDAELFMRGEL